MKCMVGDDGVNMKAEALEAGLFEQGVVRGGEQTRGLKRCCIALFQRK